MSEQTKTVRYSQALTTYAWFFLLYLVGVILFGAWVRITHSGAGCGSHWPTCHGEVIPSSASVETMIEYTHRLTSGLCGILGLIMMGWAAKVRGWKDKVTIASYLTFFFILVEGAVGAGLVLKELVTDNASTSRAVVISFHLVNTLALTGSSALAAWWSSEMVATRTQPKDHQASWLKPLSYSVLAALVFCSMSGAITALGDTLFPTQPAIGPELVAKVKADMSAANHFLVRLRVMHPIIAICTAALMLFTGSRVLGQTKRPLLRKIAMIMMAIVIVQTLLGFVNIILAAPGWMQIIHLLTAQFVWVSALLVAERLR